MRKLQTYSYQVRNNGISIGYSECRSVTVVESTGWAKLWKVNIPHRMRVFLRRFCRNTVPVRNRLRGKGVQVPTLCPMCNSDVKHLLHIFLDCQCVARCWRHAGLQYDMASVKSAPEWLLQSVILLL